MIIMKKKKEKMIIVIMKTSRTHRAVSYNMVIFQRIPLLMMS